MAYLVSGHPFFSYNPQSWYLFEYMTCCLLRSLRIVIIRWITEWRKRQFGLVGINHEGWDNEKPKENTEIYYKGWLAPKCSSAGVSWQLAWLGKVRVPFAHSVSLTSFSNILRPYQMRWPTFEPDIQKEISRDIMQMKSKLKLQKYTSRESGSWTVQVRNVLRVSYIFVWNFVPFISSLQCLCI